MKNISFVFILSFVFQFALGQYVTPGIGVVWDLDDLVLNSEGAIINYEIGYLVAEDLTVSVNDTIRLTSNEVVRFSGSVLITVLGTFQADPPSDLLFTALDTLESYKGFRFEDSDESFFKHCRIEYGGGIDVIDSDMLFELCLIRKNDKSNSTGAINLFHSSPEIINCEFNSNLGPAILSSANGASSPFISGTNFIWNNTENTNMPQINLGTSEPEVPIQILDNNIDGSFTMVGGIAISTMAGGSIDCIIQGNSIVNNRYGITVYGYDISSVIDNNLILNNNIQNIPMQGGSGINIWGNETNVSTISRNAISGNLWGITNTGSALPNLGQVEPDTINIGKNFIHNNGNGGVIYDLYNNTPNDIFAENNHWGTYNLDTVEMHIFHEPDDVSLGFVDYLPIKDYITGYNNLKYPNQSTFSIFPNPVEEKMFLSFSKEISNEPLKVQVYNLSGKIILTLNYNSNSNGFDVSELKSGMYMLQVSTGNYIEFRKFIKQ